jgi:hypothetical protein
MSHKTTTIPTQSVTIAFATVTFCLVLIACEVCWRGHPQCYGPIRHRHVGLEIAGDEYGVSFSPLFTFGGRWPRVSNITVHFGSLGRLPATRVVGFGLAAMSATLAFGLTKSGR